MPHLVDRGSFRDNLNHVIAVSHRLNFKSQNQSFAHTILDARDSCRTQTEYLSGFTVGDINLQRCAGDVFIVYNRTIVRCESVSVPSVFISLSDTMIPVYGSVVSILPICQPNRPPTYRLMRSFFVLK